MNDVRVALFLAALALTSAAVHAQTPVRVHGDITAVDGNLVSVRSREGGNLKIEITLTCKDGSQQVIVPADIPVVTAVESNA